MATAKPLRRWSGWRGGRAVLLAAAVLVVAVGCGAAFWSWQSGAAAPAPASAGMAAASQPAASVSPPVIPATVAALTTRRVGDWAVICPADAAGQAGCFVQQQLRDGEKHLVLVWTLRKDASGVHALWEVPADIVQDRGLIVDLGDSKPKGLRFSGCNAQVCAANALLAPDYLRTLEAASSVTAAVSAPGKAEPVRFPLSAKGLSEALGMLSPG